ncbi:MULTISPECIES: Do family serine endopeptidase [Methylosinus]|uniref:Probable periplasmic serine endoprotease DegP-like n=1 Tax=Methylosinus trichosporium (strain ATCC 35070 / NCIMB 11131 / UNIQEM 75 / OB3b) TaxID=595536 RepID=A0A2D2D6A5_METT3|nr:MULTISPECIES: Do family serine endopeptidase [Methylosinus]ATQ70502.1 serine peptidase [Methylosinus trichosporium OB3b]
MGRTARWRRPEHRPFRMALFSGVAALALGATLATPLAGFAMAEAPPVESQTAPAGLGPKSFADLVERVKPAVVAIKTKAIEVGGGPEEGVPGMPPELSPDDPLYRFFRHFGPPQGRRQKHVTQAQGSGFVITSDGYVVTNNHVVEHATQVEVSFDDGRTLPAKIVGTDKRTDLALLKISDGNKLAHVDWASTSPRIGDWVIAVGNPFGLGGTVTAGIVSARGRDIGAGPYDDFLQIDAPVNRGNSGGPSFDERGQVIGVNTAIYSPSGGSIGIGFAIPAEVAKDVIAALKDKGQVARGWIGVQIQPVTQEIAESLGLKSTKGALVAQPQRGGPADAAGLKSGDVITAVDGQKIDNPRELARRIATLGPGKTADITYLRGGSEKTARLKLGKLPSEKEAATETEDDGVEQGSALAAYGIEVAPASELRGRGGGEGLIVVGIDPNGSAAQKGLQQGDVILEANGRSMKRPGDLSDAIDAVKKEGRKSVLLRVKSQGGTRFVALSVSPAS